MAHKVGWQRAKISRMETGHINPSDVDVLHYLGFCGVYLGQAKEIMSLCRLATDNMGYWLSPHEPSLPDSAWSLIFHESTAIGSTTYEPDLVPGLLQTESYIRSMTTARWPHCDIDLAVRTRMERQRVLHRPAPARFTFFVHEHALRFTVGTKAIMHEQLLGMMLVGNLPHVRIRVVPASAMFGGAFRLFQFAKDDPLAYLDGYVGGLFLEDKEYVSGYRDLVQVIADVALDEGQSRELIAMVANAYDRGSAHDRVEEKQL